MGFLVVAFVLNVGSVIAILVIRAVVSVCLVMAVLELVARVALKGGIFNIKGADVCLRMYKSW